MQISDDIGQKQAVAEETQIKIDEARRGYRTCGEYNATLFFTIADMGGVDAMYQYSLPWFIGLFIRAIADAPASDLLTRRLDNINNQFTYSLYCNVCRWVMHTSLSFVSMRAVFSAPAAGCEVFYLGRLSNLL